MKQSWDGNLSLFLKIYLNDFQIPLKFPSLERFAEFTSRKMYSKRITLPFVADTFENGNIIIIITSEMHLTTANSLQLSFHFCAI